MSNAASIIVTALVSATAYAGYASAATEDKKINLIRVDAVYSDTQRYDLETASPSAIRSAQQTVASNDELHTALINQGVEINNVVRVQQMPDGTSIVYLR